MTHPPTSSPLLSSALDVLPIGVLLLGGDGSIAYANDEACHLLSVPEALWSDIVGQQWQSIMAEASLVSGWEESCAELRAAAARGQRSTRTLECAGVSGGKRWLQVTVSPLVSSPGTCMAILEDVTSSRSSEELQQLLMSGIACAQLGISIVEVLPGQLARASSAASSSTMRQGDAHALGGQPQDIAPASASASAPQGTGSHMEASQQQAGVPGPSLQSSQQQQQQQEDQPLAGRIVYVNPALERMVGRSLASLQGRPLSDVLGPCPSADDCAALSDALASRQFSQVTVLTSRERESAWTRISITPISQLPFSSMAAFPSAAWLPGLLFPSGPPSPRPTNTPLGDLDSVLRGYSRSNSGEQEGGTEQLPSPLPRATCDAVVLAMARLAGGSVSGPPAVNSHGSGGGPDGGSMGGGLGDDDGLALGLPMHCLCVHQDVSARVSEQLGMRLRDHALSSCSEGIAIADASQPDQPLVYVNDAFLQITGYSREEVLGRNCRFLQGQATSREAVATLRAAIRAQEKVTLELINYKRNGEEFWNRLSVTPVFDDGGQLVSYIGVQSDVSELMRRREEERRLLEAKVAAETATEAKSMFLANMSHEIRTPLNGMMATAQLLLASALTPEQRDLAETILESGNSLLSILGDILDFCKLDHGAMELQHEPVHMRHSVEACIELVAPEAQRKGLAVSYSIDEEAACAPLLADPIRLRQVLANLLSNAVKFTEHGEVHVAVRVEEGDAAEGCSHEAAAGAVREMAAQQCAALFADGGASASTTGGGAGAQAVVGMPQVACRAEGWAAGQLPAAASARAQECSACVAAATAGSCSTLDSTLAHSEAAGAALSTSAASSLNLTAGDSSRSEYSQPGSAPPSAPGSLAGWSGTQAPAVTPSAPRSVPGWPGLGVPGAGGEPHSAPPSIRCAEDFLAAEDGEAAGSSCAGSPVRYLRTSFDHASVPGAGQGEDGAGCACVAPPGRARSEASIAASEAPDFAAADELGGVSERLEQGCRLGASSSCGPQTMSRRVHIVVRDTGIGIPRSMMHQLFQGFRQGQEAMSRRYGGTGLGLAISRRLTELMGGTVWVESSGRPGSGSSFHVVIPAVPVDQSVMSHGFGGALGGQPFFSLLSHDEHLVLRGRKVVVDIAHDGTAQQVCQSCETLGMTAVRGDASSSSMLGECEIAVVGVERTKGALKAGWKGRPVVAVGARDVLPPTLQPLVVMVSIPVAHARLANALVKSTVLLKWAMQPTAPSGLGTASAGSSRAGAVLAGPPMPLHAPKVSVHPISTVQLAELRSWRAPHEQRRLGPVAGGAAGSGVPGELPSSSMLPGMQGLGSLGLGCLTPVATSAPRGGSGSGSIASSLYLGGQLAVAQATSGTPAVPHPPPSPASTVGVQRRGYVCVSSYRSYNGLGDGFGASGVYSGGDGSMDASSAQAMLLRRSSLDNSSLDRARVLAAMSSSKRHSSSSCDGTPPSSGSPGQSQTNGHTNPLLTSSGCVSCSPPHSPTRTRPSPTGPPASRRSLHVPHAHVLPASIPENTELVADDVDPLLQGSQPSQPGLHHSYAHALPGGSAAPFSAASGAAVTAATAATAGWPSTCSFGSSPATAGSATATALGSTPGAVVAGGIERRPTPPPQDTQPLQAPAHASRTLCHPISAPGTMRNGADAPATTAPNPKGATLPAAASQQAQSQPKGPSQPAPASQPLRILIAEDNKVNQKVVLKVLAQIAGGCVPDVVENGLQVLAALQKKTYDLILMDIHMPEMDGLEATRCIVASYPPALRPRIIALSADTLQALHDRCREAGIEEFIVKPFRVEDLKRVMQHCRRVTAPEPATATATDTATAPATAVPAATAGSPAGERRSSSNGAVRAA